MTLSHALTLGYQKLACPEVDAPQRGHPLLDLYMELIKRATVPCFTFLYRNDPPGQNTSVATQELLRLVEANPAGLAGLDPINDLKLRDMELVEQFYTLRQLEDGFQHYTCVHDPSFLDNVRNFDNRKGRLCGLVHKIQGCWYQNYSRWQHCGNESF